MLGDAEKAPIDQSLCERLHVVALHLCSRFVCSKQPPSRRMPRLMPAMSFPQSDMQISTPGQSRVLLQDVKRCLANGTLRQVKPPPEHPFPGIVIDDIRTVPDDGPWPDIIAAHFEDRGGKQYKLEVETYHGSGGSWGMVT
jgi:hypothetical protein